MRVDGEAPAGGIEPTVPLGHSTGAPGRPAAPTAPGAPGRPAAPTYPAAPSYPSSYRTGEAGRGGGWIVFLRVLLWVVFGAICLWSCYLAMEAFDYGATEAGFAVLVGGVLSAFVVVAGGMVSLDAAQNTRRTASNTARMLELMEQQSRR